MPIRPFWHMNYSVIVHLLGTNHFECINSCWSVFIHFYSYNRIVFISIQKCVLKDSLLILFIFYFILLFFGFVCRLRWFDCCQKINYELQTIIINRVATMFVGMKHKKVREYKWQQFDIENNKKTVYNNKIKYGWKTTNFLLWFVFG